MRQIKITTLLAVLMSMTAVQVSAQTLINGIYYTLDDTKSEATVTSGTTRTTTYTGNVVIPSSVTSNSKTYSVTSIGNYAFESCTGLTSITIPNSVTSIEYDAFARCTGLTSVTIPNNVTSIGSSAFQGCTGLTSITIPDGVTSISSWAFSGCSGLTSVTIPDGVTSIGSAAFDGCSGLTSIVIPSSVIDVGSPYGWPAFSYCDALTTVTINSNAVMTAYGHYSLSMSKFFGEQVTNYILGEDVKLIRDNAFYNCSKLTSITIPNSVTSIGSSAFSGCSTLTSVVLPSEIEAIGSSAFHTNTKVLVKRGSKSLLALWNAGYTNPVDGETSESLLPTLIKFSSSTQTTATFAIENIYPEYINSYDGISLKGNQIVLTGLRPDERDKITLKVALGDFAYTNNVEYTTQGLQLKISNKVTPTTFTLSGDYEQGDAEIVGQRMEMDGNIVEGRELSATGLEPQSSHQVTYVTTVNYGEKGEYQQEYSTVASITTSALELKTLAPKVITPGEVIVAAESNITNDEEKVGFEWRRTDAPDEVASRSGEAFLYAGTMEGYIHNLTSFNYWRFRPYYEAASGKRFYGNWGIVEADDYSYFEPTVHTYAKIEVGNNSAVVKGYATRGSDEVTEQGFAYWEESAAARPEVLQRRAAEVPASAMTVTATGQVMTAELTGLDYQHTYHYVAYMKTAKGNVYYGEVQTFTAGVSPTGIVEVNQDRATTEETIVKAYYDIHGRRSERPVPGLNIVLMSDGSIKKIMIK